MARTTGNRKTVKKVSVESKSVTRLKKELVEMAKRPPPLCSASLKDDDIYEWKAAIVGPPESPYDGGDFELSMKFTAGYPFEPPKVRLLTKVYHCNVDLKGNICLDILGSNWTPAMTVPTLLLSICSLLTDPNPENPLRVDIAILYLMNRDRHDWLARNYTLRYATPS